MTNKIEIHAIQSFPAHCLNRGQNNEPKSVVFGGVNRARVSSQCWKRATRLHMKDYGVGTGLRSRQLAGLLADMVPGASVKDAHDLISFVFAKPKDTAKKEKKKVAKKEGAEGEVEIADTLSEDTSSVLIFISPNELDEAAKCLAEKVPFEAAAARITKAGLSADISLFGRMLSEHRELCVDAACQVAHAFSTHAVVMENDFFTAVDDLALREGDVATAMLDNVQYNASVFYRYAAVDMSLFARNLSSDMAKAQDLAKAFIRSFTLSVPPAKQTSFAANNPPSFVMLVARDAGAPLSLANAFANPVDAKGDVISASITALMEHAGRLNEMYDSFGDARLAFIADRPAAFDPWEANKVSSLAAAIEKVFSNGR